MKREHLLIPRDGQVVTYHCDYILADPTRDPTTCLDVELAFTHAHKMYENAHPAIREAHCLAAEYPALFAKIEKGDLFPGWLEYDCIGFGQENNSGGVAYYCYEDIVGDLLSRVPFTSQKRAQIEDMLAYWRKHATGGFIDTPEGRRPNPDSATFKARKAANLEMDPESISFHGERLAGINLDFDLLMQLGLNGLIQRIEEASAKVPEDEEKQQLYTGMRMAVEVMKSVFHAFEYDAKAQLAAYPADGDPEWKKELELFEDMFRRLAEEKPYSLRSAIQMFWIYQWCCRVVNYSRMDVYLGDFLAHDLDNGVITEEEAQQMLDELWRLIAAKKVIMNGRVIIGGLGRRNEENADRFAMFAMEASRRVIETEPQLTLRIYKGQNPRLMEKALDVIGSGCVYPMIFNDDVNVPVVEKAFRVSREDAESYMPYGCGELGLEARSIGSPNGGFTPSRLLELMMYDGSREPRIRPKSDIKGGPEVMPAGKPFPVRRRWEDYTSFEEFYSDFIGYMPEPFAYDARAQMLEHQVDAQEAGFLLSAVLMHDCIERGLPMTAGARYLGGIIETFGLVDTADSFVALKNLVFDQKRFTMKQIRDMCEADFEGYEEERQLLVSQPKFGNDDPVADGMMKRLTDDMCACFNDCAPDAGLDYFLACNVNNRANVQIGLGTPALPNGRKAGTPIANGNTPTSGNDTAGITALLKSMAGAENDNNGGFTHNLKFSKSIFNGQREKVASLLDTYFAIGGASVMITCVGKEDLQNAKERPEEYRNLMVRVGGFSARFVELEPELQDDIIARTLY